MNESVTTFERLDGMSFSGICCAAVSADGRWLAASPDNVDAVCIFDTTTDCMIRNVSLGTPENEAWALDWSKSGLLAILSSDDELSIFHPERDLHPRFLRRFHTRDSVAFPDHPPLLIDGDSRDVDRGVTWSPCNTKIAVNLGGGQLAVVSYPSGTLEQLNILGDLYLESIDWSPSGDYIAALTQEEVFLINSADLSQHSILKHPEGVVRIAWDPSGQVLVTCGSASSTITLHEIATNNSYALEIQPPTGGEILGTEAIAIGADGVTLAIAYSDESVSVTDLGNLTPPRTVIDQAIFGTQLLKIIGDDVFCLDYWGAYTFADVRTGQRRSYAAVMDSPEEILQVAWHRDGRHVAIMLMATLAVWDTAKSAVRFLPFGGIENSLRSGLAWNEESGSLSVLDEDGSEVVYQVFPLNSSNFFDDAEGCVWELQASSSPIGRKFRPLLRLSLDPPLASPDGLRFLNADNGSFTITDRGGNLVAPILELMRDSAPEYCFRDPSTGVVIDQSPGASSCYRILTADGSGRLER